MNKVILVGNLASDVETRTTNSGNIAAHFRIAVDRIREGRDGQRETDFFPVVTWGKTAGLCFRYLSKGRKVAIDGRLQARSFDAQDGSKRYITEIIADQVEFLPSGQAKPESVSPEEKPAVVPMNDFYEYNNELPF